MSDEPTESEVDAALAVLRRAFWADVRGLASAWRESRAWALNHGEKWIPDEALWQIVEGSERVIYTWEAQQGLLFTDHGDAYVEQYGEEVSPSVESQMCAALIEDVREHLGDEFNTTDDDAPADDAKRVSP